MPLLQTCVRMRPILARGDHMTRPVRHGGVRDANRFRVDWLSLAAALAAVAGLVMAAWVWIGLA